MFPPNDEYAATMARICILWEDFITEATGGAAESIKGMDGHSPQWRRLYFLRRSIGTVYEIRKALHHLQTLGEFKEALSRQPKPDQESFVKAYGQLVEQEVLIKELRNNIAGGHVLQKAVQEGLNKMDSGILGMLQKGEYYKDIRFKFARELVLETMFPGHGDKNPETEIDSFITSIQSAMHHALKMIEFAFSIYMNERCISPL